jgi:hypothetical protein
MFEITAKQTKRFTLLLTGAGIGLLGLLASPAGANAEIMCKRHLTADVVAFDMPLMFNRLGAQNINGMMFALRRDVVDKGSLNPVPGPGEDDGEVEILGDGLGNDDGICDGGEEVCKGDGSALADLEGTVTLRPDKRPRPLVLRMGAGDCLTYTVTNLLDPMANPFEVPAPKEPWNCNTDSPPTAGEVRSGIPFNCEINDQVEDRHISLRFQGTELFGPTLNEGSWVGNNDNSLIGIGESATITIHAPAENTYVGTSYGATTGGEGLGGNTASGLWAVLNVGPENSAFYRSQITREEMGEAAEQSGEDPTADGHPVINYEATYPDSEPWASEGKADLPIINMVHENEIVHSDINAIVAYGPNLILYEPSKGHFPTSTYPLESAGKRNPTVPNRLEPFREFTIAYHDEVVTKQAYPAWFEDDVISHTLHGVRDAFMINYGSGGIGSEIISNRLHVGPMHDCVNCAYEEFFLTFFTVGEVAMLTDIPANFGLENCGPDLDPNECSATGPKANFALFPDDPSNVHHSYTGDFTKFRNVHAGPGEHHIHHQHNHQWLFNSNDDNSNYLDAQGIGPGAGYTYEIAFGGSGNRNKTVGDAIFHCHFYPHFAQGMWAMWRNHDTFEEGTELQATLDGLGPDGVPDPVEYPNDDGTVHTSFASILGDGLGIGNGTPAFGARALPDGEIVAGTPIPGVVPLPGKPMPPMPASGVTVQANSNEVNVCKDANGQRLPREANGNCPTGTVVEELGATGSLASVTDREQNPGYPFWIAGMEHSVGQRPPTPPLDMLTLGKAQTLTDGPIPRWDHPGFADPASIHGWDGGLPRFTVDGYSAGSEAVSVQTRLDFSKELEKTKPFFFPEEGTDLEQVAMDFQSQRCHDTFLPDGASADCTDDKGGFIMNGALPVAGAPYNEPCIDDNGVLLDGVLGEFFDGYGGTGIEGRSPFNAETPRVYKAANVQFDAVFNKLGYHYPQQRILTLWQDVVPTINKERPPEPFVLRMNTFDCTQYIHSNVVPKSYELDDYQVRTPTDVIGQHIHLPKWDLTAADGAANGWNYEDGTLSPGMVREYIEAINKWQTLETAVVVDVEGNPVANSEGTELAPDNKLLVALAHPFFAGKEPAGAEGDWLGARSTIQRWFSDPVVNVQGVDRGLGIIFTHDHYGPSTHQQVGLYATVLTEPAGSKWVHNATGTELYTRTGSNPEDDGGPTSWQAAILTGDDGIGGYNCGDVECGLVESHREFFFQFADFQHAYMKDVYVGADEYGVPLEDYDITSPIDTPAEMSTAGVNPTDAFRYAIQPPVRKDAEFVGVNGGFPLDIWEFPPTCPGGVPRPCPEAISADDPGMYVLNYRTESIAARIFDPEKEGPDGKSGTQADGRAGDLAFALASKLPGDIPRVIPELNDTLGEAPIGYAGGSCTGGVFCPAINDLAAVSGGDPFTPLPQTFEGDRVHIKIQTGAHEEEHTALIHGIKWLQAGSSFGEAKNSGWRNAQPAGISEQFTFRQPVLAEKSQTGGEADYAYSVNSSFDGWVTGTWGILRSNRSNAKGELFALPNNPKKRIQVKNLGDFNGVCPLSAPVREYDITAVLAEDVLPLPAGVTVQDIFGAGTHEGRAPNGGTLVYNLRGDSVGSTAEARGGDGPLHDPTAILYVHTADLEADDETDPRCLDEEGILKSDLSTCNVDLNSGVPVEPLVIRANAGECVEVTLRNKLLQQAETSDPYYVFTLQSDGESEAVFEDEGEIIGPFYADVDGDGAVGTAFIVAGLDGTADTTADPTTDDVQVEAPGTTLLLADAVVISPGPNRIIDTIPNPSDQLVTEIDPGDVEVAYGDVNFDSMPDLPTGNAIPAAVVRDLGAGASGMTSFQTNLMVPSACVGLHPALVEYDVTRNDGTVVGNNGVNHNVVCPNATKTSYRWYAGHINPRFLGTKGQNKQFEYVATPIEFGGFNIMAADKLKQPQKALLGAGVVYPEGSTWAVDEDSYMEATVCPTGVESCDEAVPESFRDFTTVAQKGASMFYADSYPVENILGEGERGVAEDAQDMGHMAINYGTEPLWFRFGVNPTDDVGLMTLTNAHEAYANDRLDVPDDPETAVFNVQATRPFRQHVLMPSGPGRGSTFDLHGHVWQRDPYVCPGSDDGLGLDGKCDTGNGHGGVADTGEVGSKNLGENPIGFYLGGIESWFPGEHYEIVIPSAGGGNGVVGDYLFRDHMGLGNAQGLWGIVRVGDYVEGGEGAGGGGGGGGVIDDEGPDGNNENKGRGKNKNK